MRGAKLLDRCAARIAPANDNIHSNRGKLQLQERTDCLLRLPRRVATSIEYKNAAQDTIPLSQMFSCFIELLAQKRVTRSEQEFTGRRYQSIITMPHLPIEILVEEHIAVMSAIRKIVNDEDLTHKGAQFLLPHCIERIAVHDETADRLYAR